MLDCPSLLTGLATIPLTTSSAAALICSVAMFSAPDPWTVDMFNITDFFTNFLYSTDIMCGPTKQHNALPKRLKTLGAIFISYQSSTIHLHLQKAQHRFIMKVVLQLLLRPNLAISIS